MGKLYQFGKVIVRIYANDHLPPHCHIVTPNDEALVEIATLRILVGALPSRIEKQAMIWASDNHSVLKVEWNRINPRFPIA